MEFMDAVNLILGALSAGAVAAMKDTAGQTVKDAYAGLKQALSRRLKDEPKAELVLHEFENDPQTWRAPLEKALVAHGVASDATVMELAERLHKLVAPQQVAGKIFNNQIDRVGILNQGDGATITQTNSFERG